MKQLLIILLFLGSFSLGYAQKKYTGEEVSINLEDGTEDIYGKGKHYIKYKGQAYGYYEQVQELQTSTESSAFSNKKFAKDKKKNKAVAVKNGALDAYIYDNSGKKIGKVKVDDFSAQFMFDDPYKVVYVKGIKAKPIFERVIDEGYLKP